jgi:hypothetical protein
MAGKCPWPRQPRCSLHGRLTRPLMPMSVRQGSQSYSDATCDSNSSADAMNVVSGHGGRSCFWAK